MNAPHAPQSWAVWRLQLGKAAAQRRAWMGRWIHELATILCLFRPDATKRKIGGRVMSRLLQYLKSVLLRFILARWRQNLQRFSKYTAHRFDRWPTGNPSVLRRPDQETHGTKKPNVGRTEVNCRRRTACACWKSSKQQHEACRGTPNATPISNLICAAARRGRYSPWTPRFKQTQKRETASIDSVPSETNQGDSHDGLKCYQCRRASLRFSGDF